MKISVRSIAFFPLRAIGLDPGRALINARPSETQKNHDRSEMRRAIMTAAPEAAAQQIARISETRV